MKKRELNGSATDGPGKRPTFVLVGMHLVVEGGQKAWKTVRVWPYHPSDGPHPPSMHDWVRESMANRVGWAVALQSDITERVLEDMAE